MGWIKDIFEIIPSPSKTWKDLQSRMLEDCQSLYKIIENKRARQKSRLYPNYPELIDVIWDIDIDKVQRCEMDLRGIYSVCFLPFKWRRVRNVYRDLNHEKDVCILMKDELLNQIWRGSLSLKELEEYVKNCLDFLLTPSSRDYPRLPKQIKNQ